MKSALLLFAFILSCGKGSGSGSPSPTTSSNPVESQCGRFDKSKTYSEIAQRAHRFRVECGLSEEQVSLEMSKN